MQRIYLDNAATSWPKPNSVYDAVDRYQREVGVAAGRGSYREAEDVDRILTRTRANLARLVNASPNECVFTFSCTDSLNLALHGLLRAGDHVVTSAAEHNSILRPLNELKKLGVRVTTLEVGEGQQLDVNAADAAIEPNTKLVALTHASNVTGQRQPIEDVGALCKSRGCLFLVDAAQTLGHEPIDLKAMSIDLLAAPGHKGLLGPLGTGVLFVRESLAGQLGSFRQGGTGTQSELDEQPTAAPAKYESGNQNVPGLVGLDAGVQFVVEKDLPNDEHLLELSSALIERLGGSSSVTVYSKPNRYGIVSFNLDEFDPRELATALDSMASIQIRSGLHCSPLMHRAIGTFDRGGTVRASFGHFSTQEDVAALAQAVEALAMNPLS